MKDENKIFPVLLVLFFVFFTVALPQSHHGGDRWCFNLWSQHLFSTGIGHAYDMNGLNYNPGYLYILSLFGWFQGSAEKILTNLNYLKLFTLVFDFAAIYLLMRFIRKFSIPPVYSFLVLFNIAYLYNTVVWGQVDSIHTTLVFASFLASFYSRNVLGGVLFMLALNVKLQAIVFLPHFILLNLLRSRNPMSLLKTLLSMTATQAVILIPFILTGQVSKVWEVTVNAVDYFRWVSMNAYNFWHLVLYNEDPLKLTDEVLFWGRDYKTWGLYLLMLFSGIALLPVLLLSIGKKELGKPDYKLILLSCSLVATAFFFFNTQMHERYIHPAILFAGAYALISGEYLFYALVSLAYFLNIEDVLQVLPLKHTTLIFDRHFIAFVLLLGILWGYYRLYNHYKECGLSVKRYTATLRQKPGKRQPAEAAV